MADDGKGYYLALNQQITAIDKEIAHLFQERLVLTDQLAEHSSSNWSVASEESIPMMKNDQVEAILANLQTLPKRAKVACQGVEGAFSHQGVLQLFSEPEIQFCQQFEDVFQAVVTGRAEYGVLPVENSTAGSVVKVYDLLSKYACLIVQATRVGVQHHLLATFGATLSTLKTIYSHPQALDQCEAFLRIHRPEIKSEAYANTAAAALYVASQDDLTLGAIASKECAEKYNLAILADNIQDIEENTTRFICISKHPGYSPEANKISLCLTLPHKPGALYHLLNKFAINQLNLTKLESRPWPERLFEFMFYVDIEGHLADPKVQLLFYDLSRQLGYFKILGHYSEDN